MKSALIIYDNDGTVWGISFGPETVPAGVQGVISMLPDNAMLETVHVDPQTRAVTYETYTTITDLEDADLDIAAAIVELDLRLRALEA